MSFSFRNLFNQEGEMPGDGASPVQFHNSDQTGAPSSEDRASQSGLGRGGDAPSPPDGESSRTIQMTAGELLAIIPPAISAQSGISTDHPVNVPLPRDGSNDVKLSTLYQICPNLFASEITPLNDSVATLPTQLAGRTEPELKSPDTTALSGPDPFADAAKSPLRVKFSDEIPSEKDAPEGNPFWAQVPAPPSSEAASGAESQNSNSKAFPGTDPSHHSDDAPISTGFPSNFPNQSFTPPDAGAFSAPSEQVNSQAQGDMVGNLIPPNLEQSFGKLNTEAESKAPAPEKKTGFLDEKNPFLSHSEASQKSDSSPNPFVSGPEFSTLFSKEAESDAKLAPPGKGTMPDKGFASGSDPAAASTIPTGESPHEAPSAESIFGKPSETSANNGVGQEAEQFEDEDLSAFIPPNPEDLTFPNIPALQNTPDPDSLDQGHPAADDPVLQSGTAENTFPDPTSKLPPLENFSGQALQDHDSGDSLDDPDVPGQSAVMPTFQKMAGGPDLKTEERPYELPIPPLKDEIIRDVELRAVFGTSEPFSLRKIAALIVCLPGVKACAIITPNKALQASKDESIHMGEDASAWAKILDDFAQLTGKPAARSFAVNTDQGVLSVYKEGESHLTVLHEPGAFEPGIQEKLIMITRSLDGING